MKYLGDMLNRFKILKVTIKQPKAYIIIYAYIINANRLESFSGVRALLGQESVIIVSKGV